MVKLHCTRCGSEFGPKDRQGGAHFCGWRCFWMAWTGRADGEWKP